jgi:[acyl-carrier-protein] S-malonyltransferase
LEALYRRVEDEGLPLRQWAAAHDPRLNETACAQPLIFLDSLARLESLRGMGMIPDAVAGHSLGEYVALVGSSVLDALDAARLVVDRGRLMSGVPGGMAAVLKLDLAAVRSICDKVGPTVVVANHNGPAQVVVSGTQESVDRLITLAEEKGARVVRLQVSGPFHSPLMKPAEDALRPRIKETKFAPPSVPFVSSTTGLTETRPARLRELLATQITAPVLWVSVIEALAAAGVTRAVEVGSGNVLTNLGKRITNRIAFLTYEEALHG